MESFHHARDFGGRGHPVVSLEDYLINSAIQKDSADLFDFDRFDEIFQTEIRAYQDALISSLTADARNEVERIIRDGLITGTPIPEIINDIRAAIGLTPVQAGAVGRLANALSFGQAELAAAAQRSLLSAADAATLSAVADGSREQLSSEEQDAIVDRYADNYLDYRAATIAQTETTRAASLGLQGAYQQAADRGVMPSEAVTQFWQIALDEKVCPVCLSVYDRNPQGVPLGQQFDSIDGPIDAPPAHPNCRCTLEMVTNLDLVPDDFAEELDKRVRKYSDDEPRDDHGRWTSGGGGGGIMAPQGGREFFSGNTDDLSFDEAAGALSSASQSHIEAMSADVDRSLGLRATDTSVIGAWSDGAENSVMTTVEDADWNKLRVSGAMKGALANQKAVLVFKEGEGDDGLVTFEAKGGLGDIHAALLDDGLAFHTLVPTSGGAQVVVIASDDATMDAIDKAATRYGSEVSYRTGKAEYLGVDGNGSREDAQQAYARIIQGSGVEGVGAAWDGLRDRWGKVAKVFRRVVKAFLDLTPMAA